MKSIKNIVIAGAGPAGVATGLLLAKQGHNVTLLEQEEKFDRDFRGEGLMPSGLAALHEMGLKKTFERIPSRRLTSWDFVVGGARRMRVVEPVVNGLATQIMNQTALLEGMVAEAEKLPTFTFLPGWQVNDLIRDDESSRVRGLRATCNGEKRDFLADVVIGCDGRFSRLRKLAGLTMEKFDAAFDVLWFKLPAPESLANETPFVACLQPERQFAFYPSWDGRLQIGWIVKKGGSTSTTLSDRSERSPERSRRVGGSTKSEKGKFAAWKEQDWVEVFAGAVTPALAKHFRAHREALEGPIFLDVQVGCCEQWWVPGLLLIGDAAHPMAPNRAQGINMALRDAIVVANHFADMNSHGKDAIDDKLQTIQTERLPEVVAVQKKQLAEWRKVALISTPGLPYLGFKAIASIFGRFTFAQNIWLHEQKSLREGVLPVQLKADSIR